MNYKFKDSLLELIVIITFCEAVYFLGVYLVLLVFVV